MYCISRFLEEENKPVMTDIIGTSTGKPKPDYRTYQKKKVKFEREAYYGNFKADAVRDKKGNIIPTPEQIELRKKRDKQEALVKAKRYERGHRGGVYGTNAQKKARGEI